MALLGKRKPVCFTASKGKLIVWARYVKKKRAGSFPLVILSPLAKKRPEEVQQPLFSEYPLLNWSK
jgi:hypothetical protein